MLYPNKYQSLTIWLEPRTEIERVFRVGFNRRIKRMCYLLEVLHQYKAKNDRRQVLLQKLNKENDKMINLYKNNHRFANN
jgi:hypothetical protein